MNNQTGNPLDTANLPLFYNDAVPLSPSQHVNHRVNFTDTYLYAVNQHAVPCTVYEFKGLSRHMPIVFSSGRRPVPIALLSLHEGHNLFIDADGKFKDKDVRVPDYIKRYPFLLACPNASSESLVLCFDPTSEIVGLNKGDRLFRKAKPTSTTIGILKMTEEFEKAARATQLFTDELILHDLLIDTELTIEREVGEEPVRYVGFRIVDEARVEQLRRDHLLKANMRGFLEAIQWHLSSLGLVEKLFRLHLENGTVPGSGT